MTVDRAPVALPDPAEPAEDEAGGLTRSSLFKMIAGGAAGATGLGLLTSGSAFASAKAAGKSTAMDITILQYALTLEYLGANFYAAALKEGKLSGDAKAAATAFHAHEVAHAAFVKKTIVALGGAPHAEQTFDFGSTVTSREAFLKTSATIENMCVMTLNGAAPLVTTPVLKGASELVSVEARQYSWVLAILGQKAAPVVTTTPYTAAQSMAAVEKLGFVQGSLT